MKLAVLFAVAGFTLAAAALLLALAAWRDGRHWRARCVSLESSVEGLRRELELVASISARTGLRVQRVEQEFSGVSERVEVVELRAETRSFDQAIDSARRGADPGKLAEQFGLSSGEADLVARLHGRKRSA
jgi:hypothetical protein